MKELAQFVGFVTFLAGFAGYMVFAAYVGGLLHGTWYELPAAFVIMLAGFGITYALRDVRTCPCCEDEEGDEC